jgi:hypothetical protein
MARIAAPDAPSEPVPLWPLALARIVVGALWFSQLLWKLPPDFGCGPQGNAGLCDWISREVQHPALPLYAAFLRTVVQPAFGLFGWLVFLLEATIAASLLLGLLSRLGGLLGTIQGLNLLIGLAAVPGEWYWTYVMLALLCALCWLLPAGRAWGLDALLRPRYAGLARAGSAVGRAALLAS